MNENRAGENSLSDASLLLIDDSSYARYLAKKSLAPLHLGHIYEAASGKAGLELYRKNQPELVLMDIVMEGANGLETLKELRALDKNARVIMVSAVDVIRILNDCIKEGIVDFVVKPYDEGELREAVVDALTLP